MSAELPISDDQLTIQDLEIVFHYYYSSIDIDELDGPGVHGSIKRLIAADMLGYADHRAGENRTYRTTERAQVYIEHVRQIPLPVRITEWRMP